MRNIALKLMYNGTAYHGWQVQKTVSSVCETMEKGLSKVCGGNVKLVGCGRTDAGVHAERYIANFHTEVAASNHYHVRGEDDVIHCLLAANGFRTFNLGNNFRITSCIACQTTGIVPVSYTHL